MNKKMYVYASRESERRLLVHETNGQITKAVLTDSKDIYMYLNPNHGWKWVSEKIIDLEYERALKALGQKEIQLQLEV